MWALRPAGGGAHRCRALLLPPLTGSSSLSLVASASSSRVVLHRSLCTVIPLRPLNVGHAEWRRSSREQHSVRLVGAAPATAAAAVAAAAAAASVRPTSSLSSSSAAHTPSSSTSPPAASRPHGISPSLSALAGASSLPHAPPIAAAPQSPPSASSATRGDSDAVAVAAGAGAGSESQLRRLFRQYGAVAVGAYLSVYLCTLAALYVAVKERWLGGVDLQQWLAWVGWSGSVEELDPRKGDFAVAWIATKLTEPIRLALTAALTPTIARALGRAPPKEPRSAGRSEGGNAAPDTPPHPPPASATRAAPASTERDAKG